jgi:hypothetical protein
LAEASARTFVELFFNSNNEIWVERTHNHLMLESTASRGSDSRKTGRDGIRILLVAGESAATVSTLSLGHTHIPENQKVVL